MTQAQKDEFLAAYSRVLIGAWTDDAYAERLDSDPAEALRERGIEVPAGGKLVVTRAIPDGAGTPDEDAAVAKWNAGAATGVYILSVPATPQVDFSELSDSDLVGISAGLSVGCCSCPCSCCA